MLMIKPEKIVFETEADLVDYLTKGFVPTKKNFEKVLDRMTSPNAEGEVRDPNSQEVFIPDRIFLDCDQDTMNMVLRQVYANRVRNRNIVLSAMAVAGGIVLACTIRNGCKKKDDDMDNSHAFSAGDLLDDGPVATIETF